jgi:hypothetical protein
MDIDKSSSTAKFLLVDLLCADFHFSVVALTLCQRAAIIAGG